MFILLNRNPDRAGFHPATRVATVMSRWIAAALPLALAGGCSEESSPAQSADVVVEADTTGGSEGAIVDFTLPVWSSTNASCSDSSPEDRLSGLVSRTGLVTLQWGDLDWRTTHPERRVDSCERVERAVYGEGQVTIANGEQTTAIVRFASATLADTMNVVAIDEMTDEAMQLAIVSPDSTGGCAQNVDGPTCYTIVPKELRMVATFEVMQAGGQRVLSLTPVLLSAEDDGVWFSSAVYPCSGFESVLPFGSEVESSDGRTAVPIQTTWEEAVDTLQATWNASSPSESEPTEVAWDPERRVIPGDHWCGSNRCCDAEAQADAPVSATVPCNQQLDCSAWNYLCLLMPDGQQTCWDTGWIPRCVTDAECGGDSFVCAPLPTGDRGCIDRSTLVE